MIVPVLGRPGRVVPFLHSLATAGGPTRAYFVATEGDNAEIAALERAGAEWIPLAGPREAGDYARKVNFAYHVTDEPWLFLAADDLRFHPGWAGTALAYAKSRRKRVIGTNDLGNPAVRRGLHSTHTLVARSYVEAYGTADEPGKVLHEGYHHEFVDNEFVETAQHRGEWAFARTAVVEHLHPDWGKADRDDTYALATAERHRDRALFRQRRRLWRGGHPVRQRVRAR